MPLTEADKALVRETAFEAAKELADQVCEKLDTKIRLHAAECVAAGKMKDHVTAHRARAKLLVALIPVAALIGSALGFVITKLFQAGS